VVRGIRRLRRPAFAAARALDTASRIRRVAAGSRSPPLVIGGTRVPATALGWPGEYRYRDYVLRTRLNDPSLRQPYPRLIGGSGLATLSPPQVLVSLHSGPLRALDGLWPYLPGEVTVLLGPGYRRLHNARSLRINNDEATRVAVARGAARALQNGGFLFMTPDADGTARVTAELMGIRFSLASGAFALARMTASPMVPIALRWRGSAIEAVIGRPIAPGSESLMAAQLLQWFGEYFRDNRAQLSALLYRSQRFGYVAGN
jgi:hypothetical protein